MGNPKHRLLENYTQTIFTAKPDRPRICLIRTNSIAEILTGWPLVNELKELFPNCHITTIVNEQSEAESIIAADARIDHVIKLTASDSISPFRLKTRLKQHEFDIVIAAFFAETPKRQPQRLLTLLFISGEKFICLNNRWLKFFSVEGVKFFARASFSVLRNGCSKTTKVFKNRKIPKNTLDISNDDIKRILWIRPDFIGDVVLCLPTLAALKRHYPNAQIDAIVQSSTAIILENIPELTRIWRIDFQDFSNTPTSRSQFKKICRDIQTQHYDLAIDLLGNDNVRQLTHRLKIPRRVGPSNYANDTVSQDNSHLLTHAVPTPQLTEHYSHSRLQLLHAVGITTENVQLQLQANPTARQYIAQEIGNKPFAVIHTRTNLTAKNWTDENFALVADYLVERYDLDVIFTGSEADKLAIEDTLRLTKHVNRMDNTAGKFKLTEIIALYEKAKIMITVDTGPMHIAAAVQTPIVAMLLPYFKHCYPFAQLESTLIPSLEATSDYLQRKDCAGKLLECITPEQVFWAIDKKLLP